jgi:hypothetical protein
MHFSSCAECRSAYLCATKIKFRDFPLRYYLLKCDSCGSVQRILDAYHVGDLIRQGDASTKEIARQILQELSAEQVTVSVGAGIVPP